MAARSMVCPRYAIYFVPAGTTSLYRFGATALGYDCLTAADRASFDAPPFGPAAWSALTAEPRRYGFHATLKAPFRLAEGCREDQLVHAFRDFARRLDQAPTIVPSLRLLTRFVAIVPATASAAVDDLAAACVTAFDSFRAPPDDDERRRRLVAGLTPRQIANIDRWGYPYVFDEFRFHMTLTGTLPADRQEPALSFLRRMFSEMCGDRPLAIDHLALLRQDAPDGRFAVISHQPFGTPAS